MNPKQLLNASVDDQGRLVLPAELTAQFGLRPGEQVQVEASLNEFHVLRPLGQLAKVYIEATNVCNLDCVTCMRNVWDEPLGRMSEETFGRILAGLAEVSPPPKVFFGGYGEPLAHPRIVDMVRRVKALGGTVELITNGILLHERMAIRLIQAGLDGLWVSLDGASPQSYADVRLGASLPQVIENLKRLREVRCIAGYDHDHRPVLGIAFVAMKRNIAELPEVLRLGAELGAKRFSVSNVLPHTRELEEERLFQQSVTNHHTWKDPQQAEVNLPRMDVNHLTQEALFEVYARRYVLQLAGRPANRAIDTCQFIEQGSTTLRWDGIVVPCPPLLHTNVSYLNGRFRRSHAHSMGNIYEKSLLELWESVEYTGFRERVRYFDFSPCTSCTSCEFSAENQQDCLGSPAPTCGGCLWGQGLIQCP